MNPLTPSDLSPDESRSFRHTALITALPLPFRHIASRSAPTNDADEAGFVSAVRSSDDNVPYAAIPGGSHTSDAELVSDGYQVCAAMDRYPDNHRRAAYAFYEEQGFNVSSLLAQFPQAAWQYMSYAATYLCPRHAG